MLYVQTDEIKYRYRKSTEIVHHMFWSRHCFEDTFNAKIIMAFNYRYMQLNLKDDIPFKRVYLYSYFTLCFV